MIKNLTEFPLALQLLMQTDGTVTELVKLLTKENIIVVKLSEKQRKQSSNIVLDRRIFLQGESSQRHWMYAHSQVYLEHLPESFVNDLLNRNMPIGTLWIKHRMETFKQLTQSIEEKSKGLEASGFAENTSLLSRTYHVFNQKQLIMKITEKFPINAYRKLI